jgi:hypothetical protein
MISKYKMGLCYSIEDYEKYGFQYCEDIDKCNIISGKVAITKIKIDNDGEKTYINLYHNGIIFVWPGRLNPSVKDGDRVNILYRNKGDVNYVNQLCHIKSKVVWLSIKKINE